MKKSLHIPACTALAIIMGLSYTSTASAVPKVPKVPNPFSKAESDEVKQAKRQSHDRAKAGKAELERIDSTDKLRVELLKVAEGEQADAAKAARKASDESVKELNSALGKLKKVNITAISEDALTEMTAGTTAGRNSGLASAETESANIMATIASLNSIFTDANVEDLMSVVLTRMKLLTADGQAETGAEFRKAFGHLMAFKAIVKNRDGGEDPETTLARRDDQISRLSTMCKRQQAELTDEQAKVDRLTAQLKKDSPIK